MGCFINGDPVDGGGGDGECSDIGFYAYTLSNQVLSSGIDVDIYYTLKTEENPIGSFSLTAGGLTIPAYYTAPETGRYVFSAGIEANIAARGSLFLRFYHNNIIPGTTAGYQGSDSDEVSLATVATPSFSWVTRLTAGDTVQARAFQNSGFSATLVGCCAQIFFSGALICKV